MLLGTANKVANDVQQNNQDQSVQIALNTQQQQAQQLAALKAQNMQGLSAPNALGGPTASQIIQPFTTPVAPDSTPKTPQSGLGFAGLGGAASNIQNAINGQPLTGLPGQIQKGVNYLQNRFDGTTTPGSGSGGISPGQLSAPADPSSSYDSSTPGQFQLNGTSPLGNLNGASAPSATPSATPSAAPSFGASGFDSGNLAGGFGDAAGGLAGGIGDAAGGLAGGIGDAAGGIGDAASGLADLLGIFA